MNLSFSYSRQLAFILAFFGSLGFAACSSANREGNVENQGTATTTAPSSSSASIQTSTKAQALGCKSPDAKGEKLCGLLLAGGQGEAMIGTNELNGTVKLDFDDEGRLEKIATFDKLHPDKPKWAESYTYDAQGRKDTVVSKEDKDFSDNSFDRIENLTVTYPNANMVAKIGTKVDHTNSQAPLLDVQEMEWHGGSNMSLKAHLEKNSQTQAVVQATMEANQKNQQGKIGTKYVAHYNGDPNTPANLESSEVTVFNYNADGVLESKNYSYCRSNVGGVAHDCNFLDSNNNPNANREKLVLVDTKLHYDGEKLTATETSYDGDRENLPTDAQDGTVDHTYECKMKYDDAAGAPGFFPEQLKEIGFSGKEVLKSIDCKKDGNGAGSFTFDYKPLWEVKGVVEPFSSN